MTTGLSDVRDCGAKADGSDDTAAFLKAMAAGPISVVPPGTYHVNVAATVAGYRLLGFGDASVLLPFDKAKPILQLGGSGIEIHHLLIDGDRHNGATASSILLRGASSVRVHDNTFVRSPFRAVDFNISGGYTGYEPKGGARNGQAWIERNTFTDGGADAIYLGDVDAFWVRDNFIDGAPDTGIDGGDRAQDGVISGNVIRHANVGILMSDFGVRLTITDNRLYAMTGGGIHVTGGEYGGHGYVISGNVVDPQGTGWGIATAAPSGVISGNVLPNSGYAAILIDAGSDGSLYTDNLITDPVNASFHVNTAAVKIHDNTFPVGTVVFGPGVSVPVS